MDAILFASSQLFTVYILASEVVISFSNKLYIFISISACTLQLMQCIVILGECLAAYKATRSGGHPRRPRGR